MANVAIYWDFENIHASLAVEAHASVRWKINLYNPAPEAISTLCT
jgi:hypothetical protein